MASTTRKIIAVVGATGAQGGGLVRAILADKSGEFAARALTRNPDSDKAKALKAAGAEVMAADIDQADSVKRAFAGAYGAFCITNFWEHLSPDREKDQARKMAEAAKANGLKHVIWSTLEDVRKTVPLSDNRLPTLMGKYKAPHLDAKAEADQHFRDAGVPTTFLVTSFYWENFIYFGTGPKRMPDGKLALVFPMGDQKLGGMAVEDIGKCALTIFKRPQDFIGKTVGIVGEALPIKDIAAKMGKAMGQKIGYYDIKPEDYRNLGFPGADDLGNMFQFWRDFPDVYARSRDANFTRSLNPELQTFDQWLERNASRIPLE